VILSSFVFAEEESCYWPNVNVTLVLRVYEKIPTEKGFVLEPSYWQPLRQRFTKEGNSLYIDSIYISANSNKCLKEYSKMTLSIITPLNNTLPMDITLPIVSDSITQYSAERQNKTTFASHTYIDAFGKTFDLGIIGLYDVGTYNFKLLKGDENGKEIYNSLSDGMYIQINEIRVRSATDVKLIEEIQELSNSSKVWSIIVVGIAIAGIIFSGCISYWLQNRHFKKEEKRKDEQDKDLIRGLFVYLKVIEKNIEGHKIELNKNPPCIPSYPIIDLDATFYLVNLPSTINGLSTKNFKNLVIKTANKINNINRMIFLVQLADTFNKKKKNELIREIKKDNYHYYRDLKKNLINPLRIEANQFKRPTIQRS